jgi:hypothetical protein
MSDPNAALPVAGWYPDPERDTQDRWWDGTAWSDHRRPREAPAGTVAAPPAPAYVPAGTANPYGPPSGASGSSVTPYATPYPAQPVYAPYGAYGYAAPPQNVPALVGFILALVGFGLGIFTYGLLGLAGGIVSVVGLVKSRRMQREGLPGHRHGMALAGVLVGFGAFVLTILLYVAYFVLFFSLIDSYSAYDYSGS